jgi:hypothetical protein
LAPEPVGGAGPGISAQLHEENDDMALRGLARHTRLEVPSMAPDGGPGGSARRRRLTTRLWTATGGGLLAIAVVACSSAASKPAAPHPLPSGTSPSASSGLSASAMGPSACVTSSRPAAGSGRWTFVAPRTVCGLPLDNSADYQQGGQTLAGEYKLLLSMDGGGTPKSTVTLEYQSPRVPNFYRSINLVGFEGRFRPALAVRVIEEEGYSYRNLPPGPHGGALACANVEGTENCVWATSTTLCSMSIIDISRELLGANVAANAVRIRDAVEAPG